MNYLKGELFIPIILVCMLMIVFWTKSRSKQNKFIYSTWFKRPTKLSRVRFILKLIGFSLLLISLLDFRGPEEKIESNIPDQKTIIIIDSSASMLAEDVRPNRYEKSLLMARHFIKKAFGHRVAVVLFSDTQKRLVPFTDDLDLLDARVAGLNTLKNYDGGSNISQAIKESIGYFRVAQGKGQDIGGNILVFTDSEGHDEPIDFDLPEKISLAIVGVGTLKGARIPNRDRYNTFRGYKKFEGKEVYTKLNEDWLKSLSNRVKTYKYWIANSYTIPTEEILSFYNSSFDKKINKGSATVRPVKAHYFILPALVILILSYSLYPLRAFVSVFLCMITILGFKPTLVHAEEEQEKEIILSQATLSLLKSHIEGGLSQKNKIKLAELLVRDGDHLRANLLFEELGDKVEKEVKNNHAVSLIKDKKPEEAIRLLSQIQFEGQVSRQVDEKFQEEIRQNILLALQEQKKQKKQKQEKEKEEKEKKDKDNKDKKSGENDKEGSSKRKSSEPEKKDGKESKDKSDKNKDKSKDENKENDKGENTEKKKKTLAEKQKEIEKKKKMIKVPGLIKQIMSDDRSLQQRYLDTSTEQPKARKKKDW